jgi:kelch-like protein 10
VVEDEATRPIIAETLSFLHDLETMATRNREFPTPRIAIPRVPHAILFVMGGWSMGRPTYSFESYDTRADRWVKVSCTHLHSYNALLSN